MNFKFVSVALILMAPLPFYLSVFQLVNNGGLQWPMTWANETVFWGILFSVFAFGGFLVAFRKRASHPSFTFLAAIMTVVVLMPTFFNLINNGLGQSSKADSKSLEPLQFWVSGWWKQ